MSTETERLAIELAPAVRMAFRLIPPGSFLMGSRGEVDREEPRYRVEITQPFRLGETSVTQEQFAVWTASAAYAEWAAAAIERKLMDDGRPHENSFKDKPDHPAERVTWHEAVAFCQWLSRECRAALDAVEAGLVAGLPDEAQWEHACRGGTDTEYHSGDGAEALDAAGWFAENSGETTHPVGRKEPNAWGLRDMHGNVWEWCADVWDAVSYRKRVDGWKARAWTLADAGGDAEYWGDAARHRQDPHRVLRGGSWNYTAWLCRSAFRVGFEPVIRNRNFGFRVCLVPGPFQAEETASQAEPATGAGGRGTRPQAQGAGGAEVDLAKEKMPPA